MPRLKNTTAEIAGCEVRSLIKKYMDIRGNNISDLANKMTDCKATTLYKRLRTPQNFRISELKAVRVFLQIPIDEFTEATKLMYT